MSAPQTTINAQGQLEFLFTVPDNAAFFRLQAQWIPRRMWKRASAPSFTLAPQLRELLGDVEVVLARGGVGGAFDVCAAHALAADVEVPRE